MFKRVVKLLQIIDGRLIKMISSKHLMFIKTHSSARLNELFYYLYWKRVKKSDSCDPEGKYFVNTSFFMWHIHDIWCNMYGKIDSDREMTLIWLTFWIEWNIGSARALERSMKIADRIFICLCIWQVIIGYKTICYFGFGYVLFSLYENAMTWQ